MFFEMNLSCHLPAFCESEHKTDREVRKLPLESILRRRAHESFSKRQVCRQLPRSGGAIRPDRPVRRHGLLSLPQVPAMDFTGYIRLKADMSVSSKELYAVYSLWCDENGLVPMKQRTFSDFLVANPKSIIWSTPTPSPTPQTAEYGGAGH